MTTYKNLSTAIKKALDFINTNDSGVNSVQIHGPHSGFDIVWAGDGWRSTEIEK